jgi:O-antigen/teichoic acid export membrane protein
MDSRRTVLLGALTNWLAFASTLLVAFFLSPYLISKLGDSAYGVWVFIESILAYFTLFDLGIAACVVRFVARFRATGELRELNQLVSAALLIFLIVGIAVLILGLICTPWFITRVSEKAGVDLDEMRAFTLLMFANLAITLPLSLFPAFLDGMERFTAKSLIRIALLAVRTVGTIIVMEQAPSLLNLGIVLTATNLLEHFLMIVLSFRAMPGLRFAFRGIDRETFRRVRGYSLQALLVMVSGRFCVQSAAILIGIFLSAPEITWFAVASRLIEFSKSLVRTVTLTLTPSFSSLDAQNDRDGMRRLFLQATRWTLYLILPIQFALILLGKSFLVIWLHSEDYLRWCYPSLLILASTLSLAIAQAAAARVCYGSGQMRGFVIWSLIEAGINLLLSLLLIHSLGIEGVAIGSAVANGIVSVGIVVQVCRTLELPLTEYLTAAWVRPLSATLFPVLIWSLLPMGASSWLNFGLILLVGIIPFVMMVAGFERHLFRRRSASEYETMNRFV